MRLNWRDLADRYGLVSKFFHWSVGLLIIILIPMGLNIDELPIGAEKFELIRLHKQLGVLVLLLICFRIIWRLKERGFISPLFGMKNWEIFLAKINHVLFYILMLIMPFSGWAQSSAKGYPVNFFGVSLPMLVEKNSELVHFFSTVHEVGAKVLIGLFLFHIVGLIVHLVRKEPILKRML